MSRRGTSGKGAVGGPRRGRVRGGVAAHGAWAAAIGLGLGIGSLLADADGRARLALTVRPLAVRLDLLRAREPRPRDSWQGCGDARAAGTAPIYQGEPGYREDMDGDGDGVACEPHG